MSHPLWVEYNLRRSVYSPKNQVAYDDWHEWVESLSNYEKGLPDEKPIYYATVTTRFDISVSCVRPVDESFNCLRI